MVNLILILTVTFWGLSFIATKMALDYLNPFEIIAIRLILGVPVLYLVLKFKRIKPTINKNDIWRITIASLVLGIHFIIQATGLIYTSATNTAWLIATIPAFIAVASYIFLKEKLTGLKIGGIAIASAGVILLVSHGNLNNLDWLKSVGDWIILSSCFTWVIYTILIKNLTGRYNPLSLSFIIFLIPTILLAVFILISSPIARFTSLPVSIILLMVVHGVLFMGIAHWFWNYGLSRKGATEVGVYLYFEPVVTTVAAAPILGERITPILIIGALLIILGVYLVECKLK
ncbi:MAG: DMT family transporter [Candidatus Zixiibacteriota bacterium]